MHVAIDDTSRLAYVEILDDEKARTCVAFLRRAISWFAAYGITVQRVMTDNGVGYRSEIHAAAVAELQIKHLRTRPYRPRTNGKAERFSQTLHVEWAYARQLPGLLATTPSPAALGQLLQLPTSPQRPRPQDAHQPHQA